MKTLSGDQSEISTPSHASPTSTWFDRWGWGVLLVVLGLTAYSNCFRGEFIFDDNGSIVGNPHIKHVWPLSEALSAPPRTTTAGRPIICLSNALNYALCGMEFWGWRAGNLAVHMATGLLLFGIIRRTLNSSENRASVFAFVASSLWLLHPLNTQVVNYIIQRSESIMALFYLLTLYAAVRSWDNNVTRRLAWQLVAILSCALGMGSKEVMVSAPLMVLLYDTTFVSGTFSKTLKRSTIFYAGLAATWIVIGVLVARGGTANGARLGRLEWTPLQYALTQCGVILHYLRLSIFPDSLCFDYAWPVATSAADIVPGCIVLVTIALATLWCLKHKPALGFLGVWFFVLLGPSSSILPLPDMAVEYRMYLALAAVMTLVAALIFSVLKSISINTTAQSLDARSPWQNRIVLPLFILTLATYGTLTFMRNTAYHSAVSVWRDAANKRPNNARAHANLGIALASKSNFVEAKKEMLIAASINPNVESLHLNLGGILAMEGNTKEAVIHFHEAVKQTPDSAEAHYNFANSLSELGRKHEAALAYLAALKLNPDFRDAHFNYALDLEQAGKLSDAIAHLNEALRIDPTFAAARAELAKLLRR
ncbi:MAG: tetratricopeptide repeat protein [Planctomycetota bacterium]